MAAKPFVTILCIGLLVLSIIPSLATADDHLIFDNKGHTWPPTGDNLILAFHSLQPGTELWIPAGNFTISNANLCITQDDIQIHGSGPGTLIYLTDGSRFITGRNANATDDNIRYQRGINNLLLEDFQISGYGNIEIVLGNNTQLRYIQAYDIYAASKPRSAAIRFILPTSCSYCTNLEVFNCHTNRTFNHGFQINGVKPNGTNTLTNVRFDFCSASFAGWRYPGRPDGWNWSTGFDLGEGYNHCLMNEPRILVRFCTADHNWESGFHIESNVKKKLTYLRCEADDNGQKRIYYPDSTAFFASGFIAEIGIRLICCKANNNTNKGVLCRDICVIILMKGTGNWNGLY